MMATKSPNEVNTLINDKLRKDLGHLEDTLNKINEEIIDYMQLQKTLEFVKEQKSEGFKTKIDVGANIFM